jgi:hypothetical protein
LVGPRRRTACTSTCPVTMISPTHGAS